MPDKRCPNCRRWNSQAAQVCDCGFDFTKGAVPDAMPRDRPAVSKAWRGWMAVLGVAQFPGIILAVFLSTSLGRLAPILAVLVLESLILPLIYWLLYFTCLAKVWAKALMLLVGLVSVSTTGFIAASFILRMLNPQ